MHLEGNGKASLGLIADIRGENFNGFIFYGMDELAYNHRENYKAGNQISKGLLGRL